MKQRMVVSGKTDSLGVVRLVMKSGLPASKYKEALQQKGVVCHFEYALIASDGKTLSIGEL